MGAAIVAGSLGVASVAGAQSMAPSGAPAGSVAPGRVPDKLVFGFVPSVEADTLLTNAKPLADYLSATLGIPVENYVPTDYTGVVIGMGTGQVDIGALAPLVLVQAADRFGAQIILQSVRSGATTYHSQWFTNQPDTFCTTPVVTKTVQTRTDPPQDITVGFCNGTDTATTGPLAEDSLKKLTAETAVSFVEQSSASGYIFPAVQLLNQGLGTPPEAGSFFDPATAVTPIFAGGHDKSVISVCQGDAQVGVSFNDARTLAAAVEACGADMSKVVVFALSPEIPNDGVAVAGDLDAGLKQRIADALVAYGQTEDGSKVLQSIYQISNFEPVDLASLDIVRQAAASVGAPEIKPPQ
jgi:phosphonate transport system substrate-binding protein